MKQAMVAVAFLLLASGCGSGDDGSGLSSGDRAACVRPSPARKGIAHLSHFDVYAGVVTSRVAFDPLYPHYPDALLPTKIGIAPRQRFASAVTVTASYCADGSVIHLFEPSTGHANLDLPRPSPAPAVAKAGALSVRLSWPPPVQSLGDPDRWFVTPLDYKPGLAVWRFRRGDKVIDRLTIHVCVGNAFGRCRDS